MRTKIGFRYILVMSLVTACMICLTSCYQRREHEYYANENNFITVTAQVYFINEDNENAVYLAFSNLPEDFSDDCFKIIRENWEIIRQNGGDECLQIGDEVTFVTAPRYFGDGYVMPIVAVTCNGECLLEYEQGYENLISTYK